MDVREKLVELIAKAKAMYADDYTDHTEDEYIAETLLDNFITVWDGKPIEAFLHPIDDYKGLKAKYLVFKADTGEIVVNCFILRPDKDAVAVEALRAYAKATDNETLAKDIYNWVGNGVTVQEWIPVSEPPKEKGTYIVCTDKGGILLGHWYGKEWNVGGGAKKNLAYWMKKPQPPKGE